MIERTLRDYLLEASQHFPVILITGPRQVGKSTLLEMSNDGTRKIVTLDDLELRRLAQEDPALFLQTFEPPVIIDEIQYAPELFSAIKMVVDKSKKNGLFWLTGSQKFNLMDGISESLAGRVAIMDLLGLSQAELRSNARNVTPFVPTKDWINRSAEKDNELTVNQVYEQIWQGSYPRVNESGGKSRDLFYRSYLQTYIQRDVKELISLKSESAFYSFISALAARTGQLLNVSEIGRDVGVDNKTIKSWLHVLSVSGIIYILNSYHDNVTKRLVKTPKVYFLDTGLCAYLTKWPDAKSLQSSSMAGAFLETYCFIEILKTYWHTGAEPYFYYYRDNDQKEIDLLIETANGLHPIEFKKTAAPSKTSFGNFKVLSKLNKPIVEGAVLCFVPEAVPLTDKIIAMPISYLG